MIKIIKKILNFTKNNLRKKNDFATLQDQIEVKKIFEIFSLDNNFAEIRFVGGCVRQILNNEKIEDIDLAVNIKPSEVQKILEDNKIKYYNTGLQHGTITALVEKKSFEITSLRKDIITDGRHAVVEYTDDWYEDSARRDFTINSIYADKYGNLYDPHDGNKDLIKGKINFIGDANQRIREDYLRIMRYVRFFINYSLNYHDEKIKKIIIKNLEGVKNISKDRLLDELKKLFLSKKFFNIVDDRFSQEIIKLIFPEIKNLYMLNKLNDHALEILSKKDFIFLLSFLIIDNTDNADYFLYKYNISKEDRKRILFLNKNFRFFENQKFFNKVNLTKILYKNGNKLLMDLINLKICHSQKASKHILEIKEKFLNQEKPIFPIKANLLIEKYSLKEGRELGRKLELLENIWIENNFNISEEEIKKNLLN